MKIIPIQEALQRTFDRQRRIKGLRYHAGGYCAHIGKLSPGCEKCFRPLKYHYNITTGARCDLDCVYCTTDKSLPEPGTQEVQRYKIRLRRDSTEPGYAPHSLSFSGGGEPLLYMDAIREYMKYVNSIARETGKRHWCYLYTNGVLATEDVLRELRSLGFDELRFHTGATNFSKKVYRHMAQAVKMFKTISVETPAWPPHRKKLFEMLPIIGDMGVQHLNVGQVNLRPHSIERIVKRIPDAEIYQCFLIHLDDGGLVYDIMEEVVRKKYPFSVLDCNCLVKSIQRSPGKQAAHEDLGDLCARQCLCGTPL